MERVIALVDMDCFYVQVEQRLQPEYKGKPCAVVQYKKWKGGGIIAVGYEARACGVTKNMWGDDAKKLCPDIHFFRVPEVRGKADLTKFRDGGKEVINVLSKFSNCVERASIDEAYIDLTEEVKRRMDKRAQTELLQNTHIVGFDKEGRMEGLESWLDSVYEGDDFNNIQDKKLAVGALISEEMRAAVYEETGFRCSAGIAHNKMLAKLSCGINKPNKQTVLPYGSVQGLFSTLPVRKIRNLGGKLGESLVEELNVEFIGDLVKFPLTELQNNFGDKTGHWIYEVCRGIEQEQVSARQLPKSIGCSKNFQGKTCLDTKEKVQHWLKELSEEVVERLDKDREDNNRSAKSLTVSVRYLAKPSSISVSRACAVVRYDAQKFAGDAFTLIQKLNTLPLYQSAWSPPITCLGISAGKFVEFQDKNQSNISSFLGKKSESVDKAPVLSQSNKESSPKGSIQSFFKTKNLKEESPKSEPTISSGTSSQKNKIQENGIQALFRKKQSIGNSSDIAPLKTEPSTFCVDLSHESSSIDLSNDNSVDLSIHKGSETIKTESVTNLNLSKKSGFFVSKLRKNSVSSNVIDVNESSCDSIKSANSNDSAKTGDNSEIVHSEVIDIETSCIPNGIYVNDGAPTSIDNLDEEVFMSLPLDIQHEIRKNMKSKPKVNLKQEEKKRSSLDTFFQQSTQEKTENPKNQSDLTSCEKCGKEIIVWELPEHMDFHFAQEIQKEFREENIQSNKFPIKRKSVTSPTKPKNKLKKTENVNTLTNFFSKK
ncbi:DNA polymerase eta-like [Mytilus californianus]|uniref:DNA polymerase eta-like n=1 Tax=Mytilus californianus TaxID=6549 RepID=UPI0022483D6E|nr:DNA polymerase eta-like [Mytilus californianus]